GFILYPLSFPFVLCLILGTALAALMITGFAIAYANEMFIGGVIFSIVIAPPLLIGNIFYSLGIGLAFQASALLAVVYALLCAIAFLFSLRLLKQGSKYRLTSS
ncbi:MAG: hypothetical protein RR477_09045, partial [Raoultibacter sp.]